MAEGWTKNLKENVIEPYSAGIENRGLNPNTIKVMAEIGIDISNHHSKHIDELKDIQFDYVITLCSHANKHCPVFPEKVKVIHIPFDDPPRLAKEAKTEEEDLAIYRRVRDKIKTFIENLPDNIRNK
jgi:arsenate reductase